MYLKPLPWHDLRFCHFENCLRNTFFANSWHMEIYGETKVKWTERLTSSWPNFSWQTLNHWVDWKHPNWLWQHLRYPSLTLFEPGKMLIWVPWDRHEKSSPSIIVFSIYQTANTSPILLLSIGKTNRSQSHVPALITSKLGTKTTRLAWTLE